MTLSRVELVVRRRLVRAFIEANSVSIQFTRRQERVRTEAGGWTTTLSDPRQSQVATIIPSKRRFDNGLVNAEAGQLPRSEYLLMGLYNLDVEVDDTFTWDGAQYKITGILPNREERTLCSMNYEGPPNG